MELVVWEGDTYYTSRMGLRVCDVSAINGCKWSTAVPSSRGDFSIKYRCGTDGERYSKHIRIDESPVRNARMFVIKTLNYVMDVIGRGSEGTWLAN